MKRIHKMENINHNKSSRLIQLDQLLRNPDGYTIEDLLAELDDDITERQLRNDLACLETVYHAQFNSSLRRGKKRIWKYVDADFSIYKQLNEEVEQVRKSIERLQELSSDPRYGMARFTLMQLKQNLGRMDNNPVPIISFQTNPDLEGLNYMETLADAILHRYPVKLSYKPFNQKSFVTNAHPYHLRQYNNRWVLFAWSEERQQILNFPLDRIEGVEHLSKPYIESKINFDEYFDDIIGTTNPVNQPVQRVVIRVRKTEFDYVRTKPMHPSQTILKKTETDETIDIQLKVKVNYELEHLILSYGDAMEVIAPESLRLHLSEIIRNLAQKYQV